MHMMDESFRLWEQIERESGNKIYTYVHNCTFVIRYDDIVDGIELTFHMVSVVCSCTLHVSLFFFFLFFFSFLMIL